MRRVEQIVEGEEVDVVQRDQERGAPTPEEDEGRDDRVSARGVRLRPMETGARFQLSSGGNRTSHRGRIPCTRVGKRTRVTILRQ